MLALKFFLPRSSLDAVRSIFLLENLDTKPKQCHSKDNVSVTVDASIYWRIIDVKKALFEVDILPKAIVDTCLNALRSEIGKLSLDQILSS